MSVSHVEMYAPTASQQQHHTITRPSIRSRAGCFTCRRRKKKCDEQRQVCSGCRRNGLDCVWPVPAQSEGTFAAAARRRSSTSNSTVASTSVMRSAWRAAIANSLTTVRQDASPSTGLILEDEDGRPSAAAASDQVMSSPGRQSSNIEQQQQQNGSPNSEGAASIHVAAGRLLSSASPSNSASSSADSQAIFADGGMAESDEPFDSLDGFELDMTDPVFGGGDDCLLDGFQTAGFTNLLTGSEKTGTEPPVSMPMLQQLSLFPQNGSGGFELLSYYMSRTANSMGNGSTDANPFLVTLVPLAFSDHLVLQLILAQSAVHRQVAGEGRFSTDQVAHQHYSGSLRLFRSAIGEHLSGKPVNKLALTIGSLILSLTEVARGDVGGNVSRHLSAAKSLLPQVLSDNSLRLPEDVRNFLVEHYIHMAALSLMSADAQDHADSLMDVGIEQMARDLVGNRHIGQLCGCWLELLLAIPQIFDLGRRLKASSGVASPDDILMFACIQSQVTAFVPDALAPPETRLAGLVFKQAVLLYLWSALDKQGESTNESGGDTFRQSLVDTAVIDAVNFLEQLPASSRVNTSLCWPLAVVGCCAIDEAHRGAIRTRLQAMFASIGLGNMRETLMLLEQVWASPEGRTSPWALRDVMREHQTWISFA